MLDISSSTLPVEFGTFRQGFPQRSVGAASLSTKIQNERTVIDDLYQKGCAKIRIPKIYQPNNLEAVMINTAGGITGGDKLQWTFRAALNTHLTVTSQACERYYKAADIPAELDINLTVEEGAQLNWLPQETILFDRCSAKRRININMRKSARLLMVEALTFGRVEMGEVLTQAHFKDHWTINHGEALVHADVMAITGDLNNVLHRSAVAGNAKCVATIVLINTNENGQTEQFLAPARALLKSAGGVSYIADGKTGKLIARLVAKDSYTLRKSLIPLIELLNRDAPMPKSWAL